MARLGISICHCGKVLPVERFGWRSRHTFNDRWAQGVEDTVGALRSKIR
jgi:hypothetical protein